MRGQDRERFRERLRSRSRSHSFAVTRGIESGVSRYGDILSLRSLPFQKGNICEDRLMSAASRRSLIPWLPHI